MIRALFATILLFAGREFASGAPVPIVPADRLPKGATARLGSPVYTGPSHLNLTFSSDGKRLLARDSKTFNRDDKQSLVIWNVETGKLVPSKLTVPTGLSKFPSVQSALIGDRVIWAATGNRSGPVYSEVVVTDFEGAVLSRFDVEGSPTLIEPFRNGFGSAAVSPDGRYFAATTEQGQTVNVYALDSGKQLLSEKVAPKASPLVSFAQDNATLLLKQNGELIRRYAIATGKELPALEKSDNEIHQAAVSPKGTWIVTGKFRTQKVVAGKTQTEDVTVLDVRDGATGKLVGQLDTGGTVQHFAFASDESLIVATYKVRAPAPGIQTLARWNVTNLKRDWEIDAPAQRIAIAPNGKQFASAGSMRTDLYDTDTGRRLNEPRGHSGPVQWIGFAPDGKTIDTLGGEEIVTWTVAGERKHRTLVPEIRIFQSRPQSCAGPHLVWLGYTAGERAVPMIFGWDRESRTINCRMDASHFDRPVTPDGKHLVRFRPDQQKAAATVTVFTLANGEKVREWSFDRSPSAGQFGQVRPFSGDGRFVVLPDGETVTVLDALTGRETVRVKRELDKPLPKAGGAVGAVVSANGARLAVLDFTQKHIEIYDTKTGKRLRHTSTDHPPVHAILSPDGTRLAFWHGPGSVQKDIAFWDLNEAQGAPRVLNSETWAATTCAAFGPDGRTLAVGYTDGTTLLWDVSGK